MMARMMSFPRAGSLAALALALAQGAMAQAPAQPAAAAASAPEASTPPQPSALSAELFYQLLIAELNARGNDPGAGFSLVLDAARKTHDPALYQRAVEIALQARAGESALQAARAWKQAHPTSRDANRFVLQILLALNRVPETLEPLRAEIGLAPVMERTLAISMVPRLYARASDKRQAATLVEQALADSLARAETAPAAWTTVGRMRLAAGDNAGALEAARRGQSASPTAEGPVLLALELMDQRQPQAEALVRRYLEGAAPLPELRLAYARELLDTQRLADAREQLRLVTGQHPEVAEAWLMQGVLQSQASQTEAAEASLKRYLELSRTQAEAGTREERNRGLAQAYLNLAQIAEKRGDLALAGAWLDRIQSPQDLVATQSRRASLLARQGRLDEARRLLRELPVRSPEDARTKLMAEAQLLRDNKQWQPAYDLLAEATSRAPADADLLYEQALVAEKLGRFADMERLLRQAIARKPDFPAAYNALGYALADRGVRLPEARELIRKALELQPDDPFIIDSLAWVEFRAGDKAEALRLLEKAYRERPDPEIAAHLGEVLWSLGQRERAQSIWREGLLVDRDNETLQETLKRLRVRL